MTVLANTATVFAREMGPTLRNPVGLLFTMAQPLMFLLLFGPLLGGVAGDSPWQWFVPGILVMIGIFGTAGSGYGLLVELNGGSLERMLVTPLNRVALLAGKTLKEVAGLVAQAVLVIVAVLPLGFRPHVAGTLAGLLLLAVLGLGCGALTLALAVAAKRQQELFWGVHQFVLFPLVLLSGVLLPLDDAPGWLVAASHANPVTYVVAAERALFAGDLGDPMVLYGALAALAITALGLFLGGRAMRRAAL